jgi:hypothetical protein
MMRKYLFLIVCSLLNSGVLSQKITIQNKGLYAEINMNTTDSMFHVNQKFWNIGEGVIYFMPAYLVERNQMIDNEILVLYAGTDPNPTLFYVEAGNPQLIILAGKSDLSFSFDYEIKNIVGFDEKKIIYFGYDYMIKSDSMLNFHKNLQEEYYDSTYNVMIYSLPKEIYRKHRISSKMTFPWCR